MLQRQTKNSLRLYMEIQGSQLRLPFLLGGDNINKREKEAQQVFLNNEKAVLKKLEENYEDALAEINDKIALLMGRQDADQQHVVYQLEFQRSLKAQVSAILETLHSNEFETISEYLTKSYEDGFISTMYNLQGQGIPLVFPLDQEQIVNAIQTESKLSTRSDTKTGKLYASLGDDIKDLQKKIAGEISRGIAGGQMYSEIARNISNWARIPKNNAMRITRTEMHRIQTKATMDACVKAKNKGADIARQWDASLDGKTRDSHRKLDGEIRELDEPFSNGLMYPGDPSGSAAEVINCRCALLQRARWALGNDYTKWSPDAPVLVDDDGTTQFAIIEADNLKDFSKKYKQATEGAFKNYAFIGKPLENLKEKAQFASAVHGMPQKVQDALKDVKVKVNSAKGSGFDTTSKTIHLSDIADKKRIAHEIGHAIEGELFSEQEVTALKKNLVDGLGIKDIKTVKATLDDGSTEDVFILKSNKFIDRYQSRIYADNINDCLDSQGNIDVSKMDEFVSVAYSYYCTNPKTMEKHFQEMYNLVKRSVN